ncbi:MAG TPA: cytochrome c biogenesis protein DipZ [Solirubrobacteraceae bacterium]|jgi:cytochrome c biogenesis protein CcdA/thiol-disulfide isomerase/thioredoxin|nr:cytochrome c biogenesis protein DipZ [Solirubrobacteraceae bacterium]
MLILLGFAFLAGAGTALSPCVLPVLPALLASGGVGGRRRPLGVVIGLTVTFTVVIVGVANVVDGVGLGSDPLRDIAVAVLLASGLALIVPGLADRLEARMSRIAALGPRTRGDGFRSGLLVGGALGFVYTPCAGPILAAVISVSAASGRTVAVAIAYSVGSAVVLFALTLGGRNLFDRIRAAGRGPALQRTLGIVMIVTALAIVVGVDVDFDQYVAEHIPNVNLTAGLEKSKAVESRLPQVTGHTAKFASGSKTTIAPRNASQATLLADAAKLKNIGPAPEFADTEDWFNTGVGGHSNTSLTLKGLRGKVVLIDFWTYTCINCIRTLPYLKAWDAAYRKDGLTVVGVETPEFAFEHEASNVKNAIEQFGLRYPVVQDNEMGTWNAYGNEYWPADYLIDSKGDVRYATAGEGDYSQTETAIRSLLAEAGADVGGMAHPTDVVTPSEVATPETYLGTNRAQGWRNGPQSGLHDYGTSVPTDLALNEFDYSGTWNIAAQPATAVSNAGIDMEFEAKNVYLVLSSEGEKPRQVQVLLDGKPIPDKYAGADVHNGALTVRNERLYSLVSLPGDQQHRLSLRFAPGVSGYAFTFG